MSMSRGSPVRAGIGATSWSRVDGRMVLEKAVPGGPIGHAASSLLASEGFPGDPTRQAESHRG